jgi:hypothetical protein
MVQRRNLDSIHIDPKADRPTPGRFCTTLRVSPWVPGTRLASSVRTRVSTTSFLIRGARTTASSSTSASLGSTMYLTDFLIPLVMISSVLMVTSSRDDSSTTCGPTGTSVKAKLPSWSVEASTPRSTMRTFTPRVGTLLKRFMTTPSRLTCGPTGTSTSLTTNL